MVVGVQLWVPLDIMLLSRASYIGLKRMQWTFCKEK